MQEMITYFVGKFTSFLTFLSCQSIVPGVSLLHFFLGLIVISMLIRSFLHVAR